jgi:fumarate reductase flavoprotein subunit
LARENSRGAHFRADFPEAGDLAASTYTRIVRYGDALACESIPVRFTRVRPGESLLAA